MASSSSVVFSALVRSAGGGERLSATDMVTLRGRLVDEATHDLDAWKGLVQALLDYCMTSQARPKLTTEALEAIRMDAMAEDIAIPEDAESWSEFDAQTFFENGGEEPPAGQAELDACVALLCLLCISSSGVAVETLLGDQNGVGSTALLILGYGGATMQALRPTIDMYRSRWPNWCIITTTPLGLPDRGISEQADQINLSITGCERLLVHSISNNGHRFWVQLQQAPGVGEQLRSKLRGIVYDCAACTKEYGLMRPGVVARIFLQTVGAAVLDFRLQLPDKNVSRALGPVISAAATKMRVDTPD